MKQITCLFLLFTTCLSAQIKAVVIDENNKAIPYVNIWVENENIGTTSEENGAFSINTTNDKVLVFSAVGFETKKMKVADNDKVVLKTAVYKMDEVVVLSKKSTKEIVIGNYKKGGINLYYGCGTTPLIIAKYFPSSEEIKKHPFIKNITLTTNSHVKNATFNIRFFEVNEDGSPSIDLVAENIIAKVDKGKENTTIDLTSHNIRFPEKGIFVAIEWLIIEENRYIIESTKEGTNKKMKIVTYSPSIGAVPSDENTTWRYYLGKWTKYEYKNMFHSDKFLDKFSELAIKLTLTN